MHGKEIVFLVRHLYKTHKNYAKVSRISKIPETTVRRIIKKDDNKPKKVSGPKPKLKDRDLRAIKRVVNKCADDNRRCTSRIIKDETNLIDVSTRTIRRSLKSMNFGYKKIAKEIQLTPAHKARRIELCRQWISSSIDWKTVIFTDEKRFTLDGPDNWSSYIDLERKNVRDRVRCGGGGYMIWGMLASTGLFWVKFLDGKVNSEKYIQVLDEAKGILDGHFGDNNYILQQDNCSIHKSVRTLKWLSESEIEVLEWPAKSPDLNIIENMWSFLSYKVYSEKVKFSSKNALKNAINAAVESINRNDS